MTDIAPEGAVEPRGQVDQLARQPYSVVISVSKEHGAPRCHGAVALNPACQFQLEVSATLNTRFSKPSLFQIARIRMYQA